MRIPNAVHEAHPWRIHEIAPDFTVEDVWTLPAHGGAGDFRTLLEVIKSLDFPSSTSLPTRILWSTRDRLGRWLGLGRISIPVNGTADAAGKLPIPGTNETSLTARLTRGGRALLQRARRARLTLELKFTPRTGRTLVRHRKVTLMRTRSSA